MGKNFILVLIFSCLQYTRADYIAAVVEHNPIETTDANTTIIENLNTYIYQIESARTQGGAQIIVFPEYGLTGVVQDPTNFSIEIPLVGVSNFTNHVLRSLANAAIEHDMYIVVNLLEKSTNDNNDTIYYNTNVVFDRLGAIAAKYRKINLYNETRLTAGNDTVTFTTDFGVTFGLFTGFDSVFYHPSRTVLFNSTVTDVIVPQAWVSVLPFHMSLSVQSGYSLANRVNLLAANLNVPRSAIGGSGIYRKDGVLLRPYLSGRPSTMLLFATVESLTPTPLDEFTSFGFEILDNETRTSISEYTTLRQFDFDRYFYKSLNLSLGNISEEICDGSFCCTFNISVSLSGGNTSQVYKLIAYNGPALIGNQELNVRWCNLIACTTDDISTCGERPATSLSTVFRSISASGNFENTFTHFYSPTLLRGDLLPITNITYQESTINETVTVTMSTTKQEDNVVLFGIGGRGSASQLGISLGLVAVLLIIQRLL